MAGGAGDGEVEMEERMITEQSNTTPGQSSSTEIPFRIKKLGHVVFYVSDMDRSLKFYTEVLPFKVSDRNEQGMVFLRCAGDHHTLALVPRPNGQPAPSDSVRLHHFAMEVEDVDTLFHVRDWLREHGLKFSYEGRRGPGSNPGLEFTDPDGYSLELYSDMDQVAWDGVSRPPEQWSRTASLEEVVAKPLPQWPPAK
jgi:catechol 2,3-dioxygenase-like lactoylglutathione lyase family enzyme